MEDKKSLDPVLVAWIKGCEREGDKVRAWFREMESLEDALANGKPVIVIPESDGSP